MGQLCEVSNAHGISDPKANRESRLAAEYGLYLRYKKEFHEVFSENQKHRDFGPLLQHMKVVDANGESQMDEDQWEAASMLCCFVALTIELTSRN